MEAMSTAFTSFAQASPARGQGGSNNLQRFKTHHPLTFTGGGDLMVDDHWFWQIEKILEAMKITFDTTKIRLAAFRLEGESQVWWDWVKSSRDIKAMTWVEFHKLFMSKYVSATARHAKAYEFLELKQGTMIMMEYVAKFTEIAHFPDDYVATNMAKVSKFEDRLKLSIRGKIVGLLL